MSFGNCEETTKDKIILLDDKKSKAKSKIYFLNPRQKHIRKVTVDDCVLKEGVQKCDYLIITKDSEIEHFVELKGHNIKHAISQLETTINKIFCNVKQSKFRFILTSRSPLSAASIQVYKKKFKKKYNSELIIQKNKFEFQI